MDYVDLRHNFNSLISKNEEQYLSHATFQVSFQVVICKLSKEAKLRLKV